MVDQAFNIDHRLMESDPIYAMTPFMLPHLCSIYGPLCFGPHLCFDPIYDFIYDCTICRLMGDPIY